jgi:dephospho-CoA kinase
VAAFAVAITGGIASGKSAVTERFAAHGVTIADADVAAREVVAPGQPALAEIQARFGGRALLPDGALDRRWLREHAFADAGARRDLEAITHPRIRTRLAEQAAAAPGPYVLVAIPLLTEGGGRNAYPWLQRILVVDAPEALQLARLVARDGCDIALARRMLDAQATRAQRCALADDVLINDAGCDALAPAVARLDALYRRLAGAARAGA